MRHNERLQALCRDYLGRLRHMATRHGLDAWFSDTIRANETGECSASEHEVMALSRMVDDERISRVDLPKLLGKSYRQSTDDNDFEKVKKLKRVGIYSKVSALLYADKNKNNEKKRK